MTILQALASCHDRFIAKGETPDYGFSNERISYAIVLSPESGKAVDVVPLLDTSGKKPRPRLYKVPQPVKRTSGIASNFLWDKTAYALGIKRDSRTKQAVPAEREHAAFKKLHEDMLNGADDEGLQALLRFMDGWRREAYDSLPHSEEMLDTNVVFRLDGERRLLHERPAVKTIWVNYLDAQPGEEGVCLVTGDRARIKRLHPAVKGVMHAKSSGASVVSFNLDAFESFGKSQGANAPVSERATFAYTTALNTLLAHGSRRRIQIGDATTVFWAEAPEAEEVVSAFLQCPPEDDTESVLVRDVIEEMAHGVPLEQAAPDIDPGTRYYVLGLGPNAARLSVRFWHQGTLGELSGRFREHWQDIRLDPSPWRTQPAARQILYETALQRKPENIPPALGGALLRAIITGGRYPRPLFATVVARMRADGDITGRRAAICKACLARDYRLGFEEEDVPVSLNPDETNPAYRLGRLFAVYEGVQRAALGHDVNATIKDRYFGAASTAPASIFPLLERNSAHHLSSLRRSGKGGLARWFEREIDAILAGVDTAFPRSLRLEDQGRFALGYHHQRPTKHAASENDGGVTDTRIHDKD